MQAWTLGAADGAVISGVDRGRGDPLVLVHTSGSSARLAGLAAYLARHACVTTYARSDPDAAAGADPWELHGADLVAVLERIGRPAAVVGIGGGGLAALRAGIRRPGLVSRIVVYEPTAATRWSRLSHLARLRVPLTVLVGRASDREIREVGERLGEVTGEFASLDQADSRLPYAEPGVFAAHVLCTLELVDWRAIEAARLEQLRHTLDLPRIQRLRARCRADVARRVPELRAGEVYEITGVHEDRAAVTDESGEDYLYALDWLELVRIDWG